mmetsp:Transcript_4594/g.6934  ORF Transcript_4594/g.6934 Transcript_4594/m.6934 type:complete len:335 (+) Transcript_4594:32-1036(+)
MEGLNERCKGAIVGAWVGDALGAYLEFRHGITQADVEKALSLPGGGMHKVGPGQVTDDGELTCALIHGLLKGKGTYNLNRIAAEYGKWIASRPFDLGNTIRKSLPRASNLSQHQAEMVRRAARTSQSQSNGGLMRASPLAVFLRHLSPQEVIQAVREEAVLTHTDSTIVSACCFYVLLIVNLINAHDPRSSYLQAKEAISSFCNPEFFEWLEMIEAESCNLPVNRNSGWGKIALVYSVRFLLEGKSFEEAMRSILIEGGDTDTNACILGALIGAARGLSGIPAEYTEKVLTWEPKKGGIKRPSCLRPSVCFSLIEELIGIAPESLKLKGSQAEY